MITDSVLCAWIWELGWDRPYEHPAPYLPQPTAGAPRTGAGTLSLAVLGSEPCRNGCADLCGKSQGRQQDCWESCYALLLLILF